MKETFRWALVGTRPVGDNLGRALVATRPVGDNLGRALVGTRPVGQDLQTSVSCHSSRLGMSGPSSELVLDLKSEAAIASGSTIQSLNVSILFGRPQLRRD